MTDPATRANLHPMRPALLVTLLLLPGTASAADLTLRRVMLSTGGVGYFEFEARAAPPAPIGLDIRLDQVDDVLKSLVVFDDAGGVGGIQLPGRDQSRAAFSGVPFGPDALASPLAYLNSLQGIDLTVQGPRPMQGRLLRAETVTEPPAAPNQPAPQRTRITLLTEGGLRQFILEEADTVQVTDPALRARIEDALASTTRQSADDMRHVSLDVTGPSRPIHVAYVAAAPLWKTTYRLVLPPPGADPAASKARLQAWAVLENETGTDWSGVTVAVQYGNPVTFRQALYRSYYVTRPEVPLEILGRILPGVDTAARPAGKVTAGMPPPGAPAPAPTMRAAPTSVPMPPPPPMAPPAQAAAAEEGAEETVFTIATPVSLKAGATASLPILDASIPAARIALAKPDDAHPVAAIRITNATGTSLPAGVLTLFDEAAAAPYAGDARIGGVSAGDTRLLPYAQDLRTTLEWRHSDAQSLAGLTAADGTLTVTTRTREITRVTATAPPQEPRRLLIEAPKPRNDATIPPGFAQPSEQTATAWRFPLDLKPGETRTLTYASDLDERRFVTLIDDPEAIIAVLGQQALSPAARTALKHIADLHAAELAHTTERDDLQTRKDTLDKDEARLRANLAALQPSDALRTRLLRQLDADETRHAQLDDALQAAETAITKAHQTLADAISTLKL